ncbi:hypothetical protein SEPCBS57363_003068 [Sporothrix epigloea]|uniref:Uncharacterized protein n=1 Tax=Sporothrix epigloea TaxID=1892477 RepID=A0ABP0DJF6_9PEZI
MQDHENTLSAQPRTCRIQFLLARSGPTAPSSIPAPSGPSTPLASVSPLSTSAPAAFSAFHRNANDVRRDLVHSALNRKIGFRPTRVSGCHTRSQYITESLKCLTGETPMPSRTMKQPAELFLFGSESVFGRWRPDDSLACLRMTLVEYRDKWTTLEEQRVATPWEIKQAMHQGRLRQMRTLWKRRIYAENRANEIQRRKAEVAAAFAPPSKLPLLSQSSVGGDTEDEDDCENASNGKHKEEDDKARIRLSAESSPMSLYAYECESAEDQYDHLIEAKKKSIKWARWRSSLRMKPRQCQPLRVDCGESPPRPPRDEDNDLAGLEHFQDCGCELHEDKCPTCRATAVMVAVEGEIF